MPSPPSTSAAGASLAHLMEPVVRELLGQPNTRLSRARELRFGSHGSLAVDLDKGTWFDHEADAGGGVLALIKARLKCDEARALEWLRERKLIDGRQPRNTPPRIVATYDYVDQDGELLFQVVRFDPKDFRQRRPVPGGGWTWKRGDRLALYRLPDVIEAIADSRPIYIAEGEKGADALAQFGVAATCSPGGAGKWRPEFSAMLAGAHVVILPDNDDAGRKHAREVKAALRGVAASAHIVELPGLPEKGDPFDWVQAGGTQAELDTLVHQASLAPEADAEQEAPQLASRPQRSAPHLTVIAGGAAATADDLADDNGFVTEDSVALAFTRTHRDQLRFDHHAGTWFQWNGTIWQREETKLAFSWARHTARRLAKENASTDAIKAAGKAAFSAGVERFAQADRAHAVTSAIWDRDPWLLGTPGGTVDLRTGALRPASLDDYITKQTAVAPADKADCPLWLAFLQQATADDAELVGFLRRWFGYTLTGSTKEHALLFVFGDGGNGKGVAMGTVAGIMGHYAVNAPIDSFTASKGDKHPTDMAMLAGARMVMATEVDEGQVWAEARLKALTGGDPITARFMRRDFFTYVPAFKLTISGNHKPALRNVDEAARRRFNLAPFLHRPARPDRDLAEKLKGEWPGILRWMIEGCLEWQREGLKQPEIVKMATEEYFAAQDVVGKWIAERCILDPDLAVKPGQLLADCRGWTASNGEEVPTPGQFRGAMERVRGVRYVTVKGIGWVKGIGLKAPEGREGGGGWG